MAENFDITENIGNRNIHHGNGHVIHFVHVPTHATVHFKAFLTSWDDTFSQTWKNTETVGRMDPISIYSRTSRKINFGFSIPSYDLEEASFNFLQVQKLIQMSYPTFETYSLKNGLAEPTPSTSATSTTSSPSLTGVPTTLPPGLVGGAAALLATAIPTPSPTIAASSPADKSAKKKESEILSGQKCVNVVKTISTMISPPIIRIKFDNWINDPSLDPSMTARDSMDSGLYGTLENVKFSPDLSNDGGGFHGSSELYRNEKSKGENTLIPKLLKLELVFNVLHTNLLGYDNDTRAPRTSNFPYNAEKIYNLVKVKTK